MVAVCTVSYASYLLQRYLAPPGAVLWVALLGGLYSSTATTLVLARRTRAEAALLHQSQAGIVLATAVMYLRLLIIIVVFNRPLAMALAPSLLALAGGGLLLALGWYWIGNRKTDGGDNVAPANPLALTTAATFAALFVVISVASAWATQRFGAAGTYTLAAIVGVSDIDPFVLNLAQGDPAQTTVDAAAILIAASSNNVAKCVYASVYSAGRTRFAPVALIALAVGGIVAALLR
jgi:uncharacterized membrane protein (DUF4010 family)